MYRLLFCTVAVISHCVFWLMDFEKGQWKILLLLVQYLLLLTEFHRYTVLSLLISYLHLQNVVGPLDLQQLWLFVQKPLLLLLLYCMYYMYL